MSGYWRETASEETQFQLDALLGGGLSDAEALVGKHGEFFPFALAWETGAEEPETLMVVEDLKDERPDSTMLIERTLQVLRDRRDGLDAVALVTDVYIDGQPAISVALEHRDGIHFAVLRGYRRKRLGRGYALGELSGHQTDAAIWR